MVKIQKHQIALRPSIPELIKLTPLPKSIKHFDGIWRLNRHWMWPYFNKVHNSLFWICDLWNSGRVETLNKNKRLEKERERQSEEEGNSRLKVPRLHTRKPSSTFFSFMFLPEMKSNKKIKPRSEKIRDTKRGTIAARVIVVDDFRSRLTEIWNKNFVEDIHKYIVTSFCKIHTLLWHYLTGFTTLLYDIRSNLFIYSLI